MLECAIFHNTETQYCYPKSERIISLRLRTARIDTPKVRVIYGGKYDFATVQNSVDMTLSYSDRLFNYYTVDIELVDIRLVYIFELTISDKIYYYCEDGLTDTYDFRLNFYNAFQYAYINQVDLHHKVNWMDSACFYQIFVDRFCRGNLNKDERYINLKWGEKPHPKSFAGGDLMGITTKIPYLKELGINALYLTPIFKSISNHKYDIEDYYCIDEMFGSEEDFAYLVKDAHSNGIRVVMDAVFNHASDRCKQFQDVLNKGKQSEFFDWFLIHGDTVDTVNINYECFAACSYMPKWNTSNPKVQRFLLDIALFWIEKYDIDGWRLDVSDEVSHKFWRAFRDEIKAVKSECVIVGENWHDANAYLRGDQYDSIMNYAFTKACLDYFAFDALDINGFADKLNSLLMRNTDMVNSMMLNLLDSHDTHRFITQANGDVNKLECALAILYMFVGSPCIYYGTEIALAGGYDPDCRRTFDWKEADKRGRVWQLINTLATIKKSNSALSEGSIAIKAEDGKLIIERQSKDSKVRLVVNGGDKPLPIVQSTANGKTMARIIVTNGDKTIGKNQFVIEALDI